MPPAQNDRPANGTAAQEQPGSTEQPAADQLLLGNWRATAPGAATTPIQQGEAWPSRDGLVVFERHTVTIPATWPLADVRLELDMGGRGRAFIHSKLGKTEHPIEAGLNRLPVPALAFGLKVEASADEPAAGSAVLGLTRLAFYGREEEAG